MENIKDYVGKHFVGKSFHFKCDCIVSMDFVGVVRGYKIGESEIILYVEHNKKLIEIGLNHPKMFIEEV